VSESVVERLLRRLLRNRAIGPQLERRYRARALAALSRLGARDATTLLPVGLHASRPGATSHAEFYLRGEPGSFETVVVRVDRIHEVDARVLAALAGCRLAYRNALYAVFTTANGRDPARAPAGAERALRARIAVLASADARGWALHHPGVAALAPPAGGGRRAALVTTFNRPAALARSLGSVGALGMPVLVVDDGSEEWAARANRELCARAGAQFLALPANRGLPAVMNAGLAYLLADPETSWISYFQDDVDVKPSLLESLALVEDEGERPLLTGYDAPEHPVVDVVAVGTVQVKRKRSTPAVHLHAHRSYWTAVMPIPSPYLGAPKPRVGASMEDWWITSQAPQSVGKRGLFVSCVPGLVSTFLSHRDDSSWDNPADP
jgi:hypothetical protein